jgi:hypothetical protein
VLPTFLILGAAKCGSTSLYHQLKPHPQVFMSDVKEPTFFSERERGQWKRGLEWYERLFAARKDEAALGEASTSYSKAPQYGDAPRLIASVLPEARLIYLIRNPIDQIVSNYRHLVAFEGCRYPLDEIISQHTFLIDWACYYRQISNYMEHFPRESLLVLFFEQYISDPAAAAREVCRFIGVDDTITLTLDKPQNSSVGRRIERWPGAKRTAERLLPRQLRPLGYRLSTTPLLHPSMSENTYSKILSTLTDDLESLKKFLNKDLSLWSLKRPN